MNKDIDVVDELFEVRCSFFDGSVDNEIRKQIFFQNVTSHMSDLERARYIGLPDGCRMREGAKIISPENLRIGKNVWIGENAVLDASGGLEIGSNTSIGLGVYIWTHDSHKLNRIGDNTKSSANLIKRKPTKIAERCFISGPSVVMPGVTLGAGSIVSPMSVIYDDTEVDSINSPHRDYVELTDRVTMLERRLNKMDNL